MTDKIEQAKRRKSRRPPEKSVVNLNALVAAARKSQAAWESYIHASDPIGSARAILDLDEAMADLFEALPKKA